MNIKILAIVAISVLLSGCAHDQLVRTEYVEKQVPRNAVPAPPDTDKYKPVSETDKLTAEDRMDIGKVTQAVTVDSKQKDGYIKILETVINKYRELSEKAEIEVAPLTLPPQATVEVGTPETVRDGPPVP